VANSLQHLLLLQFMLMLLCLQQLLPRVQLLLSSLRNARGAAP
jgi:hypothetical protein